MQVDGDAAGSGRRAHRRRRSSFQAPSAAPAPRTVEGGTRAPAPRPRPAVPITTGQLQVARTRALPGGPTGTAPIPIVRTPAPTRPEADPRLRRPIPAPAPRELPEPRAPRPSAFAPEPAVRLRRRPVVTIAALLAVLGLGLVTALPALAGETAVAPPVLAVHDDDVQQLVVGGDVHGGGVSTDGFTDTTSSAGRAGSSGAGGVTAVAGWVLPAHGRLGDPFGPRPQQPVPGVSLYHRGQDIVAPCGAPVHAAADGVVQTASYWGTYGNWILVDHGHGVATGYAHEMRLLVSPGQHVRAGQTIGLVGETGAATGCHLHLEAHLNGVAVNPVPFFASKGVALGR